MRVYTVSRVLSKKVIIYFSLPKGLGDVSKFPDLIAELLKRNYTEEEVKKVVGENLIRAFEKAEEVSGTLWSQYTIRWKHLCLTGELSCQVIISVAKAKILDKTVETAYSPILEQVLFGSIYFILGAFFFLSFQDLDGAFI